ncbi:MAG TPA: class I SAM-dependent methyltransferase [Gaiellaceae bacterium]|nr:class I SAM-dependent methyltransferase [Gaiellaceae bacterium]
MNDAGRMFGRVAAEYELGRPSWPPAALDLAERELGLGAEAAVLEIGAGTGKLTRALVERFASVAAVEPDAEMRALISSEADVLAGTAEQIPLPDESVAAVFCGESFHWFDWPRAIPEIARVLRPGGGLVLMWNRPSGGLSSAEWPPAVGEALDRLVDPVPPEHRYLAFAWRDAFAGSPFEELRFAIVPNGGVVDRERLLARIASWSHVAALPEDERRGLLEEIAAHLTEPSYSATLETHLYWTRRSA